MKLSPGERRACEACGTQMIGALTASGATAPVVLEPDPQGNVLLFKHNGMVQCRTFSGFALDELRAQRVPLRLNHFADCPERDRFKK